MNKLNITDFQINKKWPAKKNDVLQLYSIPTPNGQKISTMLEETGIEYEAHKIPFGDEGVMSEEFLSLNPNNKIPAIIDPHGPDGKALPLFESGAILIYLAEKTGKFYGKSESERYQILKWLMFQMAGAGPIFGQLGFFYNYGGKDFEDKRPLERYVNESKRLLGVIDKHLTGKDWLVEDYSIADMALAPWLNCLINFYKAEEILEFKNYKNISQYMDRFNSRPAVKRGNNIPEHSWE